MSIFHNIVETVLIVYLYIHHARAEEVAKREDYREQFDLCVSRAVARLNSLAELCLPFVKKGGFFIPYKAAKISEELQEASFAISQLGGEVKKSKTFLLPNLKHPVMFYISFLFLLIPAPTLSIFFLYLDQNAEKKINDWDLLFWITSQASFYLR